MKKLNDMNAKERSDYLKTLKGERASSAYPDSGSLSDGLTPYERDYNERFQKDGMAGITQSGSAKGISRGNMTV